MPSSVLDQAHAPGIVAADRDGRIYFANVSACIACEHRFATLEGCDLRDVATGLGALRDEVAAAIDAGVPGTRLRFAPAEEGGSVAGGLVCELSVLGEAGERAIGLLLLIDAGGADRDTRERFEKILDVTPSSVVITRLRDGIVLDANAGFLALTGLAREDILGRDLAKSGIWASPRDYIRYVAEVRESASIRGFRAELRRRDGSAVYVLINGEPIRLQGDPCLLTLMTDVTAETRYLRQIERQHELFDAVYDAVPDAVVISDAQRRVLLVNRAVNETFGYDPAELMGRNAAMLYESPEVFDSVSRARIDAGASAAQHAYAARYRRRDGSIFPGESHGNVLRDQDGGLLGFLDVVRDVSQHERDARALEAGQRRLRDLVGIVSDWVWEVDGLGRFTYTSDRVTELLGYDPQWLLGRAQSEITPPDEAARLGNDLRLATAAGSGFRQRERVYLHRDGSRRLMSSSGIPDSDAQGVSGGYRGACLDVTASKRATEKLRHSEAQLNAIFDHTRAGIMLVSADERIERCNRSLAQMLGYDDPTELVGAALTLLDPGGECFAEAGHLYVGELKQRGSTQVEGELRRKSGDPLPCLCSGKSVDANWPAEVSQGVIWTIEDLTELKRKELELRALSSRVSELNELFAAGPAMVFRWLPEPGWPVSDCSPNVERLLGVRAQDFVSGLVRFETFLHPDDIERIKEEVRRNTAAGADDFEQEYRLRGTDGKWHHFFDYTRVLRDRSGAVAAYHGYLVDITEQRRRESELRALMDAIPDLIFIKDGDGRYLECNDAFARFIGRSREKVIGNFDHDLFAPDTAAFFRRRDAEMLDIGEPMRNEEWVNYPDGARRLLDTLKMPYARAGEGQVGVLGISRDTTEQRKAELALRESEERYRSLFQSAGQPMLILDHEGVITDANRSACELLGYAGRDDLLRRHPAALSPLLQRDGERSAAKAARMVEQAMQHGYRRFDWDHLHSNGRAVPVDVTLVRVLIDGQTALLVSWYDLSDKHRADEAEIRASVVFENTTEGIMITNAENRIIAVNPAFTEITGFREDEVLGRHPSLLQSGRQDRSFYRAMWSQLSETGRWRGELWNRRKDGDVYAEWLSVSVIRDERGEVKNYIGVFSDITQVRRSEQEIEHLTHYDPLTGLPNLMLLRARLDQALRSAEVAGVPVAVVVLNLDGFKRVVSSLGHETADNVLACAARRLAEAVPRDATISRNAGDAFTLVMELHPGSESLANQVMKLQQVLREQIDAEGVGPLALSCSAGIALYPTDAHTPAELLRYAESALHKAKDSEPGSVAYYRPEMTAAASQRLALEQSLRNALAQGELELYYQPKLDLESGVISGAEALIRWHRAEGGVAEPASFMSVVETSELVYAFGSWILRSAAQAARDWHEAGLAPLRVSVNVSGAMITAGKLAGELGALIRELDVDPAWLEIEVLENILLEDPIQAHAELSAVRNLGVAIALDDFGTGYSSLGYLKRFPFDYLKIDRGFIRELRPGSDDMAIVRSTISMAHHLGMRVVAEGVVDEAQINLLLGIGCDSVQGYLVGRPMPMEEFRRMLGVSAAQQTPSASLRRLMMRRVLLVGGDDAEHRALRADLTELGWYVLGADSAEAALDLLGREQIYLLITDSHLPGMDGIALTAQARERYPDTVRVMISEARDPDTVIEAVNRGGIYRYLCKPYDKSALAELLESSFALARALKQAGPVPLTPRSS